MIRRTASIRLSAPTLIGLAVLTAADVRADSFSIQPHVSTGVQDYKLDFLDAISANPPSGVSFRQGFAVQDHLSFIGGGLTGTYRNFFVDISGQWSGTGHDLTHQIQGNSIDGISIPGAAAGHDHLLDGTFDRHEFNATLGWGFTSNFSAYLGYKRARLNLNQVMSPVQSPAPVQLDVLFNGTRGVDFTYQGLFIGATYSVPVKTWGAVSIQSSLARLNSRYQESYAGTIGVCVIPTAGGCETQLVDPSFANDKAAVHGTSNGFNVGISWTGGFAWFGDSFKNLSYTVGVDRSQYAFDSGNQSVASQAGNFQETITRIRFDLRYRLGSGI